MASGLQLYSGDGIDSIELESVVSTNKIHSSMTKTTSEDDGNLHKYY